MTGFTIYTKDNCRFCTMAKALILDMVDTPSDLEIINNPSEFVVSGLKETYNHNTYPFIFLGNEFIGGYSDLVKDEEAIQTKYDEQCYN